jgi:MFS family permease
VVISPLAPRLITRFGPKALMTAGMVFGAVGVGLMTRLDESSSYWTLLPGFLLFGVALGFVYSPMSIAAMEAMPRAKAGIAAGVLAMNRVLAGAVLLAATGAIFASLSDSHTATYALSHALYASVALCAIGAVLTFWLVASPPRPAGEQPEHHHPHTLPH